MPRVRRVIPVRLPDAPPRYDAHNESVFRRDIERAVQDLASIVQEASAGGGGGGGFTLMAASGRYTWPATVDTSVSNTTAAGLANEQVKFYPFVPSRTVTIDQLAFEVSGTVAGQNAQIGIYDDNEGYPGTLLLTSGNMSVASLGVVTASVTATELTAGTVYWLAIGRFGGGSNPNFRGWTTSAPMRPIGLAAGTSTTTIQDVQISETHAGASNLPTSAAGGGTYLNNHRTAIGLRTQ